MGRNRKNSQLYEFWKRFRRNKLAIAGILFILLLIFVIAREGINDQKYDDMLAAPSMKYLFGTDQYGRDIFSRMVYGTKYTISMGLIAASISAVIGIFLGSVTGYYGGKMDNFIMRAVDIFMTLPNILLALVMTASFGPGLP